MNKVVVISGASHGLGLAISQEFYRQGADVVMLARDNERLQTAARSLTGGSGRVLALSCDVSDKESVAKTASRVVEEMGRVDVLVNNAGIPAPRSFLETELTDWDEVIGTNLTGIFYLTRSFWDALIQSGAGYVVNISGSSGLRGGSSPAYGSAKFGMTGLTRSIAISGKEHNLRATVLYPDAMDTGWRGAPIGVKPRSESMDPAEVARLIVYLVGTPFEFVVNEAVLSPLDSSFL